MIRFDKVTKYYGTYKALDDINAEVAKGEVVVVCGPSGSGKSTLIRTVNRLEEIASGTLTFDGGERARRRCGAPSSIGCAAASASCFRASTCSPISRHSTTSRSRP